MEINPSMFSHQTVLCCSSCCVGFPYFAPLEENCGSLDQERRHNALTLSRTLFLSFCPEQSSLRGELGLYIGGLTQTPNNTCNADECGEREKERKVGGILQCCVAQDPPKAIRGHPWKCTTWQKLLWRIMMEIIKEKLTNMAAKMMEICRTFKPNWNWQQYSSDYVFIS